MSGPQFRRNNQFRPLLAQRLHAGKTEQTFGCDIPFLHAAVLVDDNDAIERRIEDRLAVLFAGGELVLLFSRELPRRFHQDVAKKLVNYSLGFSACRSIEFRPFAGKGVHAVNGDYLPDAPKSVNDLVEGVFAFPAMPQLRVGGRRFLISTFFSFFFETFAQGLTKGGQIIVQLLVSGVAGKRQFRLPSGGLIPSIGNPFRTIEDKAAKFR